MYIFHVVYYTSLHTIIAPSIAPLMYYPFSGIKYSLQGHQLDSNNFYTWRYMIHSEKYTIL